MRLPLLLVLALSSSGCLAPWLAALFDAGNGEVCPGTQRETCREAREQGGSVCGTGAAADAYQALYACACAGDTAPCASACGTELCAGEATPTEAPDGGLTVCWHCLTGQCLIPWGRCNSE